MDLERCPCSGASLPRPLRPAVLALLAHGKLHGYRIARRLERLRIYAGREPDPTGLYRTLRQMESEGLLRARWELARRGPARRVFELTRTGRACLERWRKTLASYRSAVDELVSLVGGRALEIDS